MHAVILSRAIEFKFRALYLSLRGILKSTVSKEEHTTPDKQQKQLLSPEDQA